MIKINLPVLLAQRGLKVADIDRDLDISRSTLYRLYNNDVIKIDIDAIDKLCNRSYAPLIALSWAKAD